MSVWDAGKFACMLPCPLAGEGLHLLLPRYAKELDEAYVWSVPTGAVTPRSQAAGGADNNRAAEEGGHEDGEGDEEMGDGADEAAAEEEQHNGGAHADGGGGPGGLQQEAAAAGDRFIADPEGSPQREAREAADGDDGADDAGGAAAPEAEDDMEAVAYAADGAAETVEDLLK